MAQVSRRVTNRGAVRYDVRTRVGGRVVTKTFTRKRDADAFAASIETAKLRGSAIDPRATRITFGDYATRWLGLRHDLRPRTREDYATLLRVHLLPAFGRTFLGAIEPSQVRSWHASLAEEHPPRAAKAYRLLRTILNAAITDRHLVVNPCQLKTAGVEHSAEREIPTVAEVEALAGAMPPRLSLLVLLAAWCGLRRGEVLGLTRGDVDLLHGTVRVQRAVSGLADGTLYVGEPKTAAGRRTVTVPPHLLPNLEAHLEAHVGPEGDAPLFPAQNGSWLRPGSLQRHWERARRAVGVSYHLHDLRHFGATLTAATGASTREIMARIGHASPAAALRYQHATEDRDRVIAAALSELSGGQVVKLPRDRRAMEGPE